MDKRIKIAVVDDHVLLREGLVLAFHEFPEIHVLFDAGNGKEMLTKMKEYKPDVILLDIAMPEMGGEEALKCLREKYPRVKTLMLSSYYNSNFISEFMNLGANGFLPKHVSTKYAVDAIKSVKKTGKFIDENIAVTMGESVLKEQETIQNVQDDGHLTNREKEVMTLVGQNKSNKEIANIMFRSRRTIEGHRLQIKKKTNCKTALDMIKYALDHRTGNEEKGGEENKN